MTMPMTVHQIFIYVYIYNLMGFLATLQYFSPASHLNEKDKVRAQFLSHKILSFHPLFLCTNSKNKHVYTT